MLSILSFIGGEIHCVQYQDRIQEYILYLIQGTEWLFYTSPWRLEDNTEVSNIRITSKVASFSLVSYTPSLQDYGSAMIYNIGIIGA